MRDQCGHRRLGKGECAQGKAIAGGPHRGPGRNDEDPSGEGGQEGRAGAQWMTRGREGSAGCKPGCGGGAISRDRNIRLEGQELGLEETQLKCCQPLMEVSFIAG